LIDAPLTPLKPYTPIDHDLASFRKKFPQCENRRRIAIEIRKRSRAWRKEIYERSNNRGEARYQRVQVLPEVPRPGSNVSRLMMSLLAELQQLPQGADSHRPSSRPRPDPDPRWVHSKLRAEVKCKQRRIVWPAKGLPRGLQPLLATFLIFSFPNLFPFSLRSFL